jgi:DNA-binding CsgD family transcriptional regulator
MTVYELLSAEERARLEQVRRRARPRASAERFCRKGPGRKTVSPLEPSARELEVLSLTAEGNTSRQVAELIVITEHTVKSHLKHLYRKLGVRSAPQAVAVAIRKGLIP